MSPRLKSILLQVGSFVLGAGLLALALRAVPFGEVWADMRMADPRYLAAFLAVAMLAHVIRAWRWRLLLGTLTDEGGGPAEVQFWPAFSSVMIGYMVNYAAPRLGEVARTANLSARERLPFSGVLGTVVVERVLDVLVLGLCVLVSLTVGVGGLMQLGPLLEPLRSGISGLPPSVLVLALAVALALGGGVAFGVRWLRRSGTHGRGGRFASALYTFRDGLVSVLRARQRGALIVSTFAIWGCYLLLAYLPLPMLGITALGFADAWVLLVVGSIGVAIPTPGGVGSYHYLTIQTMTRLLGVAAPAATAYAVLSHAIQLILFTSVGFACLVAQGQGLKLRPPPPPPSSKVEQAGPMEHRA